MGVGGGVVPGRLFATAIFVAALMISLPFLGGVQGDSAFSNQDMSMAGGNPQNNGLSHYNTTGVGNGTRWILSSDVLKDTGDSGYMLSGFCVGPDGTIYTQKQDYLTPSKRGLAAINPWGTLKWFSNVTAGYGEVGQSLVIGQDGNIYCIVNTAQQTPPDPITGNYEINVDNRILALNPDNGTKKWEYASPGGSLSQSDQLAVCPNGLLVFPEVTEGISSVTALYPNGSLAWSVPVGGLRQLIAVSSNSTTYVVSSDGLFHTIEPNGTILGNVVGLPANGNILSISLDSEGNIYFLVTSGDNTISRLYKYYSNYTLDWIYEQTNCQITIPPVIDGNENIYISYYNITNITEWSNLRTPGIMSIGPDGHLKWTIPDEYGQIAISSDGNIYVASLSHFISIKSDGTRSWEMDGMHGPSPVDVFPESVGNSAVAIGPDGSVMFLGFLELGWGELDYILVVKGTPIRGDPGLDQQLIIPILSALIMLALLVVLYLAKKKGSGRDQI